MQTQNKDCLSCKIVGASAFTSVGIWTIHQRKSALPRHSFPLLILGTSFVAVGAWRMMQ